MGQRRASLLQQHDVVLGKAIGPYIRYARPPVDQERLAALRRQLGRVLLLILPIQRRSSIAPGLIRIGWIWWSRIVEVAAISM